MDSNIGTERKHFVYTTLKYIPILAIEGVKTRDFNYGTGQKPSSFNNVEISFSIIVVTAHQIIDQITNAPVVLHFFLCILRIMIQFKYCVVQTNQTIYHIFLSVFYMREWKAKRKIYAKNLWNRNTNRISSKDTVHNIRKDIMKQHKTVHFIVWDFGFYMCLL